MTQLYLIRHGIAVERNNLIKDEDRPLTDVGTQKTAKVAEVTCGEVLGIELNTT